MLLQARGIGMRYPGVRALVDVDLDVAAGEVHALVGENGAGKSTLARILAGEVAGYDGEVSLDGTPRAFRSPREALEAGVGLIPQELQIVDSLSVAENILLGHEPHAAGGWVRRADLRARARASLEAIDAQRIDVDTEAAHLSAGDRQMIAIARALSLRARLLIMDEPTAALGEHEAERLTAVIRRVVAEGTSVVYVSHKLQEVLWLADRVTVLRDGHRIATLPAVELDEQALVHLMVGRDILRAPLAAVPAEAAELLRVEGFGLADPARPGGWRLKDVSLCVRAGEIVGLTGLVGAGRTDLLRAMAAAADRLPTGRMLVRGQEVLPRTPAEAAAAGIVLLPEERKADGIFGSMSVAANMTMSALQRVSRRGWIDAGSERRETERMAAEMDLRAAGLDVPIATLSGGNQQKALLARSLFAEPSVLLLDEPTRGIDLAAKEEIYRALRDLAGRGLGVVLCSSDLSEVLTQCHRIVVMRDGGVVAEFAAADGSEEKVMAAATGADRGSSGTGGGAGGGATSPPRAGIGTTLRRHAGMLGLAMVLLLAIAFSPLRNGFPIFLDPGNLADILRQVSEKGILAVGMTAVVITGGIDLSVGSVLAFGATLSALLLMQGWSLALTALAVLAACAAWGAFNGVVVSRWRLPAFIVTLATMSAARGAARYLSGGTAIPLGFGEGGATESVRALAGPLLPYVPAPALIFVLSVVAMHLLLSRTTAGRYFYAIGDNESAARLSGVRVAWNQASVYVISAALAGLAGLVHCAQLQQGNPNDGVAYELDAIAAVVVGGTALRGGAGTVGGTLVGVLIIGIINNSLGLNNVDANLQLILKGAIILAAVWLQRRQGGGQ